MESLHIILDLTKQGLRETEHVVDGHDGELIIGGMPEGTEAGKPIVMIALEHPDPEIDGYLVAETTLALFLSAADVLKTKYGDPRQ